MKVLITGGCGFLGSNLSAKALANRHELWVYDNLYRNGAGENFLWLRKQGKFDFIRGDVRNVEELSKCIRKVKPDIIYHLAGQVALTTSIKDPKMDFEVNVAGTHNLLEAVRVSSPSSIVVYSSTNKVYGDLEQYTYQETETRFTCVEKPAGFGEDTPLRFSTPYGCSKGAADQYVLDYAKTFGLKTVVFRHSSIYGGRQFSTYDQGWIGWFCQKAVELEHGKPERFNISGSGKQVRDVLHVDDAVNLYFRVPKYIGSVKGKPFNIGGGLENSLSLLELFDMLEGIAGVKMRFKKLPFRQSDQKVFVADIKAAAKQFNWHPKIDKQTGIKRMYEWVLYGK